MDKQKTFCDVKRTGSGGWKRGVARTKQTCPGRSSVEPLRVFTKTSTLTKQRHLKAVFIPGVLCTNFGAVREKMYVFFIKIESPHRTLTLLYMHLYASQSRGMEFCVCVLAAVMGQMHVITHTAATRRPP